MGNKNLPQELKDKKIPRDEKIKILKNVLKNIVIIAIILVFFFILNMANQNIEHSRFFEDIKIFAGAFLIIGIVFLEQSYKRKSGYKAVQGIEMIVFSAHTLSALYVITKYGFGYEKYLEYSAIVVAIYFVLKSIIVYTMGTKAYINRFYDVSEIVKDEPQKKEATKKKIEKNVTKGKRLTGTKIRKTNKK